MKTKTDKMNRLQLLTEALKQLNHLKKQEKKQLEKFNYDSAFHVYKMIGEMNEILKNDLMIMN